MNLNSYECQIVHCHQPLTQCILVVSLGARLRGKGGADDVWHTSAATNSMNLNNSCVDDCKVAQEQKCILVLNLVACSKVVPRTSGTYLVRIITTTHAKQHSSAPNHGSATSGHLFLSLAFLCPSSSFCPHEPTLADCRTMHKCPLRKYQRPDRGC